MKYPVIVEQILLACWDGAHGESSINDDGQVVYYRKDGPVTDNNVEQHLSGDRAYSIWLTSPESDSTRLAVIDLDNKEKYAARLCDDELAELVIRLLAELELRGVRARAVKSRSGTGTNLWCTWTRPAHTSAVRAALIGAITAVGLTEGSGGGVGARQCEIFICKNQGVALPCFGANAIFDEKMQVAGDQKYAALPPSDPLQAVATTGIEVIDTGPPPAAEMVKDALQFISADDYDTWINISLALKLAYGDEGKSMWLAWSQTSSKWNERNDHDKWNSLNPNGQVTIGTVIHMATCNGWVWIHALADLGNAYRLRDRHGNNLKYVDDVGVWMSWGNDRWHYDNNRDAMAAAKETVKAIKGEASLVSERRAVSVMRWALRSQSRERISAMLALASSEPDIAVASYELDQGDLLLNVKNGVLDLEHGGVLIEPRRHMLITKQANVIYDPDAQCPRWRRFLEQVVVRRESDGNVVADNELIAYMQRMAGYMLTGNTSEQCLFVMQGAGANGKSVFTDVIRTMLGDYASAASSETFLLKKYGDGIRNDIARLVGARVVTTSEFEEGQRMSESLVKLLTGEDAITARFLRKEFFEFKPKFKIMMATNHKPRIKGDDYAIWRRIRLIPFTYTVPEEDRDRALTARLVAELPGILNWALEGCAKWLEYGLQEPDVVRQSTERYRHEEDVLRQWYEEERCVVDRDNRNLFTPTAVLYEDLKSWWEDEGLDKKFLMAKNTFGRKMSERGFEAGAKKNARGFFGIGLTAVYANIQH